MCWEQKLLGVLILTIFVPPLAIFPRISYIIDCCDDYLYVKRVMMVT